MATRCAARFLCAFVFLGASICGVAQESAMADLPANTNDALHAMSRLAGVIFTGEVIAMRRQNGANGATGVVEIDFAIEDAIRGVSGGVYTLREWGGLWQAGEQPFRVGQRYLMLLHAPGAGGLSSPVGGQDGAIPILGSMQTLVSGPTESMVTSMTVAAAPSDLRMVDTRWVATRVVQPLPYASQRAENRPALNVPENADAAGLPPASSLRSSAYSTVLGMLRGWEKADHATN